MTETFRHLGATLFVIGTLCSNLCLAQITDEQLYHAYLSQDLTLWGEYIATADWAKLSASERTRLINYYYGYIPFRHDAKADDCRQLLDNYLRFLESHRAKMTPSEYATYRSSAHAYEYLLDNSKIVSEGLKSFKLAKQAVELDSLNPVALSLKGNVDFYAPKFFGGSKKRAMRAFLRAEKLMHDNAKYKFWWNYPALQLCIAQCYEKEGDIAKAVAECERILREHPDFRYVRDEYLPSLRKKM